MSLLIRVLIPLSTFLIFGMLSTDVLAQTASQASVDAIEAKADGIDMKIDAVDTEVGLIHLQVDLIGDKVFEEVIDVIHIDTTGPKLDAIEAKLDAHLPVIVDVAVPDIGPLETMANHISLNVTTLGAMTNEINSNLTSVGQKAMTIESKIDAIEAKLDVPDITEIDQTGPKLDAIEAKLDANFPIDVVNLDPLVTLGNVLEDKIDSNGDKVDLLEAKADLLEAKIDSLGGDIGGLEADILNQVNSIRDLELEQAILACNCSPGIFLPASAGGNGERGMTLVAELLDQIRIIGVDGLADKDLDRAECYILEAQKLFDNSRYGEACEVLSGSINILSFGKSKICTKASACK